MTSYSHVSGCPPTPRVYASKAREARVASPRTITGREEKEAKARDVTLPFSVRDNLPRRTLKRIALAAFEAGLAFERKWRPNREKPQFELGGSCQKCARCCEAPAISVFWPVRRFRSLRALFLGWQKHVNRFHLVREDKLLGAFVFRCEHFDRKTRRCGSYDTRPGMCRDYPRRLMYQPAPEMLDGCGYRPVAFGASRMMSALKKQKLTEEQMEKLRKGLFLD